TKSLAIPTSSPSSVEQKHGSSKAGLRSSLLCHGTTYRIQASFSETVRDVIEGRMKPSDSRSRASLEVVDLACLLCHFKAEPKPHRSDTHGRQGEHIRFNGAPTAMGARVKKHRIPSGPRNIYPEPDALSSAPGAEAPVDWCR